MEVTNTINHGDAIECEICFDNGIATIPLIPCSHSHSFCEECVKRWLTEGRYTCPKCRKTIPVGKYLMFTGQAGFTMADTSITMEYNPSLVLDLEPPHDLPLISSSCTMHNVLLNLLFISMILLAYLILYLFYKLI